MALVNIISSSNFMANSLVSLKFYDSITGVFLKEVTLTVRTTGSFSYSTSEFINGEKVIISGTGRAGSPVIEELVLKDYVAPNIEAAVNATGTAVFGTSEPGATVQIKSVATGTILGTAIVAADGTYSVNLNPALVNAEKIEAIATDSSNNFSSKSLIAPDITPPAAPTNLDVVDVGHAVVGKAEPNSIIIIRDATGVEIGAGVTDTNGNFKVSISPAQINKEALTATATDAANNESTKAPFNAHDLTAPNPPSDITIINDGATVNGTAEPNSKIEVKDIFGTVIGTGITDATGHFSVALNPAQNNGQTITLTATDDVGNQSGPALAIANNAAPVITIAEVDATTGATINGQVSEQATVVVKNAAGVVLGTGQTDATGAFSFALTPAQANGEKVYVTATDTAPTPLSSTVYEATAPDITAPNAPTDITIIDDGTVVTGKAEPNSTIEIKDPTGTVIGTGTTDASGNFSIPVNPAQNNGQTLTLTATDDAGNTSDPAPATADNAAPVISVAEVNATTGATISGQVSEQATVVVKNAAGVVLGTGQTDATGAFSFALTPAQANGEKVYVTATDTAPTPLSSTVYEATAPDITAPNAPTDITIIDDGAVVTGKAEPNSTIEVKDPTGTVIGTGTTDGNGNFTIDLNPAQNNGQTITLTATDDVGNQSGPALAIANNAAPIITIAEVDATTGATISGQVSEQATVVVKNAAGVVLGTGQTDATGAFSFALTPAQANGEKVYVTATDTATTPLSSTVYEATAPDITAPNAPTDITIINDGAVVTGKAEPNSTIEVKDPTGTVIGTGPTDANGNFSVNLNPAQNNGQTISLTATDNAGNTSDPTPTTANNAAPVITIAEIDATTGATITGKVSELATVVVKNAAGVVLGTGQTDATGAFSFALTPAQANGEKVYVTATDTAPNPLSSTVYETTAPDITAPNTPTDLDVIDAGATVTGKAEPNSKIEIKDPNGVVIGTGTTDASGNFSIPVNPAQNNGQTLTLTATDDAGNTSAPASALADNAAPVISIAEVNATTGATISGQVSEQATVVVKNAAGVVLGTGQTDATGAFTFTLSPAQANGEKVYVTATDTAPNPLSSTVYEATAPDITAPNAPTDLDVIDAGATVTGKAEPNSKIIVKDSTGTVIGTGITDGNGNFTVGISPAQKNGEELKVSAQDAANNTSPEAPVIADDITPPALGTPTFTADGTQVVGTAEANSIITVKDVNGNVIGTSMTDANGVFAVTLDRPYGFGETVNVTATDQAGNISLPQNATAPVLIHANNDVAQADVDLGYKTTTSSYTEKKSFGSVFKFLGMPILGCKAAEINFNVGETQKTNVDIKATNLGLSSLFDAIKVTLYKQNTDGSWAKVVSNKDVGLFNKFFLFFPEQGRISTQNLEKGNYKIIAEDLTLFSFISVNCLNVTYKTETRSDVLDVLKVNVLEGDVLLNDVGASKVVTKITNADGKTVDVIATGTTLAGKYGTIVIEADGSYKYTPNKDIKVVGQVDQFTYSITDANGNVSTAKVFVQIKADEVKLEWNPNDPSQPAKMLSLKNDVDTVHIDLFKQINTSTQAVTSGELTATYNKSSSVVSSSFTVASQSESVVKVAVKGGYEKNIFGQYKVYQDADDTTFTWQLQRYNSKTSQWENVAGQSGSKYFDKCGNCVYTGNELFSANVNITEAGKYRVNFTAKSGYCGHPCAQEFDTDVTVTTKTLTDQWSQASNGSTSGNIFTGLDTDSANVDTLGIFAKKLAVSIDGGATFTDVTSSSTVQGLYGKLVINANGDYSYTQTSNTPATDNFVYKVTAENGETATATLKIGFESTVHGTAYADNVTSDAIQQVLELGAGADSVKFTAFNEFDNHADIWTDFSKVQGDKIDVSSLLSGQAVTDQNISQYISVVQDGSSSVIRVDLDGSGTQYTAKDLVVLQNQQLNLDDLLQSHSILY
ncbi:BapA/Bap/LapF family large adhesin [Acinetobacter sp. P8-3-8]|uniref:BapA/Bap/LapF family large adhesin n=1 Tax=Acinetobacter sp. P8-3-8 TaxID=1029823 RepID=UPI0002485744|nr:BapA/Bap/LapF family large adhesin [Acinetobacter sp. P8-3-8]